ncbi:alkanesulfonate monooxygenase [Dietzia sp. 2505]|uniref:LLM class flavin-dependent oxidoreductase n=1 Tax=Dietzia sp. 2505 TaxID=3156457 RepID=UPI0033977044
MSEFVWRLPSRGDGRSARAAERTRGGFGDPAPTIATDIRRISPFDNLDQVIDAAELTGWDGVLAPHDPLGEESWVVTASALRATRYVRGVVEFTPTFGTPVYAAKMSATLQTISSGRLDWRIHVDVDPDQARALGDDLTGEERYRRADEFLTVARGVWNNDPVPGAGFRGTGATHSGEYFHVLDGGFRGILSGRPFSRVLLSGSSEAALELSSAHADIHLLTLDDDPALGAEVQRRAADHGRTVRLGLELPVVARETDDEAWSRIDRLLHQVHPDAPAAGPDPDARPDEWSGFDAFGYPTARGLVGSYDRVARRFAEWSHNGIDYFVVTGHPHIDELHRGGEHWLHLADPAGRTLTAEETSA